MLKTKFLYFFLSICIAQSSLAQNKQSFTRADSLRGNLTPLRTCYDINFYHLDVKIDIDNQAINGSNLFKFTATRDFDRLQFDLFENLSISKVVYRGAELKFTREFNAVFVDFPSTIKKGTVDEFTVYYSGNPTIAKRAPWDGGFVFSKDKAGKPWIATAVQGFGASSWWPTKDHQADEVDSMLISISVPPGLMDVSNGRLRSVDKLEDGFSRYNWYVSYPINNYSVSLNIADYKHFSENFQGENGNLTLDYYVLPENLEQAKTHFAADVKPMLSCFENWFGPYPFYRDGFKLIETPYLGMEHQSAVTYGNKYKKGYLGRDLSGTGLGLAWDFIIIHESGHEWFGNNITSKDIADMWIHEGFTSYSEGLFVECTQGKEAGIKYIAGVRKGIKNDSPIIGSYNVNSEGSGDMYPKGANLLQTIRALLNNDTKWREILRGLNKQFGLKTTTSKEVEDYLSKHTGMDLKPVFDQYLRTVNIPELSYEIKNHKLVYKWTNVIDGFNMPVLVSDGNKSIWLKPGKSEKSISFKSDSLSVDPAFYVNVKLKSSGL
ncbi:M1 family metallopeptidase [Flavihumibacter sp. R14]|nr:M1 family metallopeptidase [Flavihumibacter soli]